eukprot:NODE_11_length_46995_cov_0.451872.p15 type:complete len:332 gc:universal NODE_11_length_46995_cov_0.451872:30508-31503(+)
MDKQILDLLANPAKIDKLDPEERNDFEQTVIQFFLETPQLANLVEELTGGVTKALGRMLMGNDNQKEEDSTSEEEEYDEEEEEEEENVEDGTAKLAICNVNDGSITEMFFDRDECARAAEFLTENKLFIKLDLSLREPGTTIMVSNSYLVGYDGEFLMQPFGVEPCTDWERYKSAFLLSKRLDACFENLMSQMDDLFKIENHAFLYDLKTKQQFELTNDNRGPTDFLFEFLALLMQSNNQLRKSKLPENYGIASGTHEDVHQVVTVEHGKMHRYLYVNNKQKSKGKDWYLWLTDFRTPVPSQYKIESMEIYRNNVKIGIAETKEDVLRLLL